MQAAQRPAGAHQFHSPSSVIVAGTRRMRTRVASMATAVASATPVCLMMSSWPVTNPANTMTMMSAAEVMMRPERCRPAATASSLPSPESRSSLIRASRNTS